MHSTNSVIEKENDFLFEDNESANQHQAELQEKNVVPSSNEEGNFKTSLRFYANIT